MLPAVPRSILAAGLCSAAAGCDAGPSYPEHHLDGITVLVGFDEPICGGTFAWMESRLRWLARETGLPASVSPISYYWLRDELFDYCPTGACTSPTGNTIYSPLELFSHELVHAHLAPLGLPRPWLAEGMATMLEDAQWSAPIDPMTPSQMLSRKAAELSYDSAGSFVRYLRGRYGMPALIELYGALDRVDAEATPDVFLAVLGDDWHAVEDAYLAAYIPVPVGALNCDFPVVTPQADTWTIPVDSPCDGPATLGPFLGLDDTFPPVSIRHVILDIREPGTYLPDMTTSAITYVAITDCDAPFTRYSGSDLNVPIELLPGRKRLDIKTDIADEAVGEITLRGPLTPGP